MIDIKIENGTVIVSYTEGMTLDLDTTLHVIEKRKKIQAGKSYPALIYFSGVNSHSKQVREIMATQGVEGMTCAAFVVKNAVDQIHIQYFLSVDVPSIPMQIFFDETEAIAWLKTTSGNSL